MKYTIYQSQAKRAVVTLIIGAAVLLLCILLPMPLPLAVLLFILSAIAVISGIWSLAIRQSISSMFIYNLFRFTHPKDRHDPEVYRMYLEKNSRPYVLPEKYAEKYGLKPAEGFSDTWMIDESRTAEDPVIYYLHGGGYWNQLRRLHFMFFSKLARRLHAKVYIPAYPLAPAHHAEETNRMVLERYLQILEQDGIAPEKIIFMGDSAGGGLSVCLMQALRDKGLPRPKEAVLLCPWMDVSNSTQISLGIEDPILEIPHITYTGQEYAGVLGTRNPLVSPIYGDLTGLPKITVFSGSFDSLNYDLEKMADMAAEQGFDYTLYVYPRMIHDYIGIFFLPEARYGFEMVCRAIEGEPVPTRP